jgi:hypothetical protein
MSAADQAPSGVEREDVRDPLIGVKLLLAWAFVGIPLAWGVWQVAVKSLSLFR